MPPHDVVKFLLVDDIAENLLALEGLLRRDGLELVTARSGVEALELLLVHDFALALLDVQMSDMDGFELAELMRGTNRTRHIPIIFLTAVATDERRRFRGYEAGAVDYLLKPFDPQLLSNKARVYFELERQRQELARQRDQLQITADELSAALERLRAHADNSPLGIVELDAETHVTSWSEGAARMFGWSASEAVGARIVELGCVGEEDVEVFAAVRRDMLTGKSGRGTLVLRGCRKDGVPVECEWYVSALMDRAGKPISIKAQILDITERRHAEQTQQLLIGELNHRVKNMLATVQAIATQTLRHSANPSEFATKFSGRIQSLARAHSLLSCATWQGAKLAELIQDQLRLGTIDHARFVATGPEVNLAPQVALHLALILHELGTNANKHGALSTPLGRIDATWSVQNDVLRLRWAESGGPTVTAPVRRGFGTTLIEQSVRSQGGAAQAAYRADGLTWDITLLLPPARSSEAADRNRAIAGKPDAAAAPRGRPVRLADGLRGKRLLVIEDEPLVALELKSILQDAGADMVGLAGTAEQALQMIEGASVDAALLDGNLLGSPVDDVAAALTRRNIAFTFVSGYGKESLPSAFRHAAVLAKPFTPDQLLEAVARLVSPPADILPLRR